MSASNIRKSINDRIRNTYSKKYNKELEFSNIKVLRVSTKPELINSLKEYGYVLTSAQATILLDLLQKEAEKYQKNLNISLRKKASQELKKLGYYSDNDYLIDRKDFNKAIVGINNKIISKITEIYPRSDTTKISRSLNSKMIRESDNYSREELERIVKYGLFNSFIDYSTSMYKEISSIDTMYRHKIGKNGKLDSGFKSNIQFTSDISEDESIALNKVLKGKVTDSIVKEYARLKGSPSFRDIAETFILSKFRGLRAKIKSANKRKNPSTKGKATSKYSTKKPSKPSVSRPIKPKARKTRESPISLRNLIPLINTKLHDQIKLNMGSPALNYRTGRFARSARVTDIREGRQGNIDINYSYQKDPYQLFEFPGGSPRLATPDRDPRNIIGKSVRELASEHIASSFNTRRV